MKYKLENQKLIFGWLSFDCLGLLRTIINHKVWLTVVTSKIPELKIIWGLLKIATIKIATLIIANFFVTN